MKPNIGVLDSIIRIALGMIIMGIGLSFEAAWGLLGLIPIATFVFKWSVMYQIFGINTCEKATKSSRMNV
jgi:hypothetical protein